MFRLAKVNVLGHMDKPSPVTPSFKAMFCSYRTDFPVLTVIWDNLMQNE